MFWNLACSISGKQDQADASIEALKVIPEPINSFATVLVEICAYAGKTFDYQCKKKMNK